MSDWSGYRAADYSKKHKKRSERHVRCLSVVLWSECIVKRRVSGWVLFKGMVLKRVSKEEPIVERYVKREGEEKEFERWMKRSLVRSC